MRGVVLFFCLSECEDSLKIFNLNPYDPSELLSCVHVSMYISAIKIKVPIWSEKNFSGNRLKWKLGTYMMNS